MNIYCMNITRCNINRRPRLAQIAYNHDHSSNIRKYIGSHFQS